MSRARATRALLALLVVVTGVGFGARGPDAHAAASDHDPPTVRRVLLVSLPDVDWSDLAGVELPNLERLFARSAIGGMVTNGALRPSTVGASYVALGAGARSVAPPLTSGQGFDASERFGLDSAGVAFRTRTGTRPGDGLVYLPIADTVELNDAELYASTPGRLGDELARAGIGRAVIANGDGSDPSTPEARVPAYRRAAVAALMTGDGRVPGGRVARDLLRADRTAPFGVRLDHSAVLDAFGAAFTDRTVVLVEASDLVRAEVAARSASEEQGVAMMRRALRDTDALVGALLDEIDPARDAVMVVGTEPPRGEHGLTIAALQAPGIEPGLLVSTTTNHDGFVNITDVAPTVLRLFGLPRADGMEGRKMETGAPGDASGGATATRIQSLVDANTDGLFRDGQVGAAMTVVVVLTCLLAIAAVVAGRWWRRARALLVPGALLVVGVLDATYLASPFHFGRHGGTAAYWVFVAAVAMLLAVACALVGRRLGGRIDALLVALGSIVALHLLDLVTGAHLEWNAVFGYSPTIGIRFVGQGNLTFGQLVAATVLFAGLIAWRVRGPWGPRIGIGLLAVTVVVMAAPMWGNDFGSVLSAVPAFALMAWMLAGHRLTVRSVIGVIGVAGAAIVAVALVDLVRPANERTHVGKFFVKLVNDTDSATLVIRRKAAENLSVLGRSVLLVTVLVVIALLVTLWVTRPRELRTLEARVPTARAIAVGFLAVAALGFLLNDSGVTIPGMMFAVLEAAVVFLVATVVHDTTDGEPVGHGP